MPPSISVILMLGPAGASPAERWVAGGRQAALADAVSLAAGLPGMSHLVVAAPRDAWFSPLPHPAVTWDYDPPGEEFHFGRRLSGLLHRHPADAFIYLGAGSAPLLPPETLAQAVADVAHSVGRLAVTNNLYSSDWLVANCPTAISDRPERFVNDNALGWVLKTEAGVEVRTLPVSAATRLDIDTPADLQLLGLHPAVGPTLSAYLGQQPFAPGSWAAAGRRLAAGGGQVALIGRVASGVWAHVEAHTQAWIRVFSEERGMTASGRLAAGQVKSLLGAHLARLGPTGFFAELSDLVEAAFFDTRVLMAAWDGGRLPSAADRYASDLLRPSEVGHARLREFTAAAAAAPIPIVLGGHGVVAGDLYGLVEIIESGSLV